MTEDIEGKDGATEGATALEDSQSYSEILAGEGAASESAAPAEKTEEEINLEKPEVPKTQGNEAVDQEVILEIGGKSFTLKESEAVKILENASKIQEREKSLTEKEKSLNRDYTQKTQQLGEIRKSFETNFGRMPKSEEVQALGKVWKAYFENPEAQKVINDIIAGNFSGAKSNPAQAGSDNPIIHQLNQEVAELKEQLRGFLSSTEEEKVAKAQAESENTWKSWVSKKGEAKIQITDEIDAAMAPFVGAIRSAHPDWDAHKVLDEAYRHATIDTLKQDAAKDVLKSADGAKRVGSIKITPKVPSKADKDMSYADIVRSAQ